MCKPWSVNPGDGEEKEQEAALLGSAKTAEIRNSVQPGQGAMELVVGDFRESESFCCRQMMRRDLQS